MVVVREAEQRDVSRLLEILDQSPEAGRWTEEELRQIVPRGTKGCLVAEDEGSVIGLLVVQCPAPDEAEILTVAVEPAARRRGAARTLIATFQASRQGQLFLEVRRSNTDAQRLYRSCGFLAAGVRTNYYSEPVEDALILRRACD